MSTVAKTDSKKALQQRPARHTVTFNGTEAADRDGVVRYEIMVFDGRRQWSVRRRYKEFVTLHADLKKRREVPPLPPKGWLRKRLCWTAVDFMNQRFEKLNGWLKAVVAAEPTFEGSPELAEFLRRPASSMLDVSVLAPLPTDLSPSMKHVGSSVTVASDVSTQLPHVGSMSSIAATNDESLIDLD